MWYLLWKWQRQWLHQRGGASNLADETCILSISGYHLVYTSLHDLSMKGLQTVTRLKELYRFSSVVHCTSWAGWICRQITSFVWCSFLFRRCGIPCRPKRETGTWSQLKTSVFAHALYTFALGLTDHNWVKSLFLKSTWRSSPAFRNQCSKMSNGIDKCTFSEGNPPSQLRCSHQPSLSPPVHLVTPLVTRRRDSLPCVSSVVYEAATG